MHQVKNQPLLKFAWDVQNLIQTIESNNPDPGPMRSVWDTICMAMKQVNEPQVIAQLSARSGPSHGISDIFVHREDLSERSRRYLPSQQKHTLKHTFKEEIYLKAEFVFGFLRNINYSLFNKLLSNSL